MEREWDEMGMEVILYTIYEPAIFEDFASDTLLDECD